MANINKIRVSGTTYNIQDINAPKVIELTQSEYDALTVKDPNAFYVITDSEYNFDGYWTSAQTQNAIAQSVSSKADTSAVTSVNDSLTAHTANTTVHVTAQDKTNWNAKSDFSGNYNDLTNKPTIPTVPTNVSDFTNDAGYITSDDISGKTNQSDFTAHTANTTVHVTASEKSTWNSKSDFSGNYNDLSNKPTIPSKTSDLTNDSNFATTGDVQTATNDMATKTWVGNQGYLTEHQSLSNYYTKSETSGATQISTALTSKADTATTYTKSQVDTALASKQSTLESGTNIKTINNESILGSGNIEIEGGGKAVSGGTNISITTGETADTINCTLPISKGSGNNNSLILGTGNGNTASGQYSIAVGGRNNSSSKYCSLVGGNENNVSNEYEAAFGNSNKTNYASTNFGDSGNTLFSVGNGPNYNFRHNAFEIRQDGSIYIPDLSNGTSYRDRPMIKLQDALGGGGASYTAGDGIDITNDVISVTGKVDTTAFTAHTADTTIHVTSSDKSSWNGAATNASNAVTALGGLSLVKLTQAEYDALATKDSNTLYVING